MINRQQRLFSILVLAIIVLSVGAGCSRGQGGGSGQMAGCEDEAGTGNRRISVANDGPGCLDIFPGAMDSAGSGRPSSRFPLYGSGIQRFGKEEGEDAEGSIFSSSPHVSDRIVTLKVTPEGDYRFRNWDRKGDGVLTPPL